MVTYNLVNIGSDNGLVPIGTKPLPGGNIDFSLMGSYNIRPRAIALRVSKRLFSIMILKIILLKLPPPLSGTSKLIDYIYLQPWILRVTCILFSRLYPLGAAGPCTVIPAHRGELRQIMARPTPPD